MTTVATALNREALADWYRQNRQRSRQLFDLVSARGLLRAADLAPAPDRVLRGAPSRVQSQHAREEGARPGGRRRAPRAPVRARHRSGRRGVRQPEPACRMAIARRGSRVRRRVRSPSFWTRLRTRLSSSPAIRCCTRRRRCTRSSSTRRCTRKRCSTCGISCRYEQKQAPADAAPTPRGRRRHRRGWQSRPAARRLAHARGEIPFGWDNEFPGFVADVPAFEIDVHNVTNEQFMDFVDAGGYRDAEWWRRRTSSGSAGRDRASAVLDARERNVEVARHVRAIDLPPAWPVYVSQAEAAAYARGRARVCRRRLSTIAPPSANRRETSGSIRGATRRPIRARSLRLRVLGSVAVGRHPRARAPGACTI